MAITTFREIISGLTMTWTGDSVTGETQYIPQSSPYEIFLDRVPKVLSTGASMLDNTFSSIADMQAAGVSFTIGGGAGTITTNSSPSAGEAYFQITDTSGGYGYSTRVVFNSADKGKAVVINYVGYASNLAGNWLTRLHAAVERLETFPACAALSLNEYSAGRFDDSVADSTSVYLLPARGDLVFMTGRYAFSGATVDLTTGNTQVAAFTDVDGYKQIAIWLIDNSGTVEARISEGAEAATPGATTAPAQYAGDAIKCDVLVVQGDGTGAAGGIEDVEQADITACGVALTSTYLALPYVEFVVNGYLAAEEHADAPVFPKEAGTPVLCTAVNVDMGDDDVALSFDVLRDNTTSIFASAPSLATGAGGGVVQTLNSTDFDTTDGPWTASEYLAFSVLTKPTDGRILRVRVYYEKG